MVYLSMKHYTLAESPGVPVSHDPSLIKKLLVRDGVLPGIRGLSHIVLSADLSVETHIHDKVYEVFYCIGGRAVAVVGNNRLTLEAGHCLIVEPGEPHSFENISEDTELLYFSLQK